jgi:hypothetical protein
MSMKGGLHFYIAGSVMLLALAGCGRGFLQTGERATWRHEAEVTCLKSGAVKIGAGVVQISPIEGPGMCGADFPLKVAALGESSAVGYADDLRPPGDIPNGSSAQMPRWPLNEPRYAPPQPAQPVQSQPIQLQPIQSQLLPTQPLPSAQMLWSPGPPPVEQRAPSIEAPQVTQPAGRPVSLNPPGVAPYPDDIPDDAVLPPGRNYAPAQRPYYVPQPQQQLPALGPSLGPMRGPQSAAVMPAALTPPATLACPLVSALDRWVSEGVQPAAMRWFGAQVVEIKQISAYSCRGMVGAGTSHISEHAFGNALDVAGFILADGRKITVQEGWHGSPEEQGFLHDVQLYACGVFSTVLSPGYNPEHYNHIHVDLMRRESGRRPCRPDAIPGEVVAARARAVYAAHQRGPAYTGSIASKAAKDKAPVAIPGEDGYVADEDDDAPTGSITARPAKSNEAVPGADGEFDDDVTGSIPEPRGWPRLTGPAAAAAIKAEERRSAIH